MRISEVPKPGQVLTSKIGTDYGGWTILPSLLKPSSIAYSFGIGEDISFDLGLIHAKNVEIHAFDPTPKSQQWLATQDLPNSFHYYGVGLSDSDGSVPFNLPINPEHVSGSTFSASHLSYEKTIEVSMLRLSTIMKFLLHTHIDLLKMDIEGSEYAVIDDMLNCGITPIQLLVEFHHRFESIGNIKTQHAIQKLQTAGYEIFHSQNNYQEVSFVLTEAFHGKK